MDIRIWNWEIKPAKVGVSGIKQFQMVIRKFFNLILIFKTARFRNNDPT